ncbi:hypothetical protein HMPREF0397_1526 [Fusobacterium nucleatum subsp. nucleatum ATCC 23726]|uniref:Uncharacterized protein n=1 Tax=Fusobacterium nucleatum subsp. nucleatum (strain ATCC 23726 / VPI 4351) TaxID=525283 RepID=D5RE91_FUSN2|nr:hypothetical protein C4N14_09765 [Fusobacterium nucleatum subsp. nucleatum ATCC 23726]EFG94856.1 hypothetical protein HMPREF0397_1526 [Fusobacterium nucleatum subsp. nucleatum ATCC 23726]
MLLKLLKTIKIIGRNIMSISVDNLIKILPAIIVILLGIWLLKKFFNILIAVIFIAVVIFVVSKYI